MISAQESREDLATSHVVQESHALPARFRGSFLRQRRPVLIRLLVAVLGLFALAAGAGLVSLPLIVALAARQMPASTILRRLAVAVIALFGLNAALLTVLAVLGLPVEARLVAAIYLVGFALAPATRDRPKGTGSVATVSDWWALGSALTAFTLFYRPFVGASLGRSMAQLSFSTDGANHLSLVRRNVLQGGYLAESDYPPAWAGNVALVVDMVGNASPGSLLLVAPPLIMAFYALLVFFVVALTLDVLHAVVGKHSQLTAAVAVSCIGLTALVGSGNLLIRTSSYTQTVAMTALLVITSLLVAPRHATWRLPAMLGLLSVALMQTWYLLAPVLAVMLMLYLVLFRPKPLPVLAVAIPTVLLSAYPLLKGPPPVTQLNALGITPLPYLSIVLAVLLLTVVAVAVLLRRSVVAGPSPLLLTTLIVATLLLAVGVIAIQVFVGAGAGYYTAKVLYVVLFFGALAGAAAAGLEAERGLLLRTSTSSGRPWLFSGLLVALMVGGFAGASVGTRDQSWPLAAGRGPDALDGAVLDAIFSAHPSGLPPETDAWVFDGCSRGTDFLANKWIHDFFQTWSESRHKVSAGYRSGRTGDVNMLLDRAAEEEVQRVEIYNHRDCSPDALARLSSAPKIVIVSVR